MKIIMFRSQSHIMIFSLLFVLSFLFFDPSFSATPPSVEEECSNQFTKVAPCLTYATGKASTPTEECCSSVKDIKESNPVCLCYIIQQAHKGGSSVKDMGLQEDKLLQLPTVCKLVDTSISRCPKLLNLSPSSPDNAIFTNSTSSATPTTPSSSVSGKKEDGSAGLMLRPHLPGKSVLVAVFVSVFLTGFISMSLKV